MRILPVLLAFACLSVFSCKEGEVLSPSEQLQKDIGIIQDYLAKNNLTAQSTASGLHYIIDTPGTSDHPAASSKVTVQYSGYLTDGSVFDKTSPGQSVAFPLKNLILGWQEGIPIIGRTGKIKLLLPSALGYGPQGSGSSIPPNAVIIFDITLVDFQ